MFLKIRPVLALTVALSLFNGCFWDEAASPAAPTISGLAVTPNQVAKTGDGSKITGTLGIEAESATVSFKVTNSTGDMTSKFTIKGIPASISTSTALAGTIVATSADDGAYTLSFTVTDADGQVVSQSAGFRVGADIPSIGTVDLGAQGASAGSFLQLTGLSGNAVAWTSGAGKPVEKIDLVFGQDGSSVLSLMSPDQADGDGFTLGWATTNVTYIKDMGTSLPSKSAVIAALAGVTAQKATASVDHYYGLKLADGSYAAVLVNSLSSATRTATASVTSYK